MTGFAPVAGREELRSAMRNRYYNNVSRPGSYGFVPRGVVTADMSPLGRPRSLRGLGNACDDVGANLAVGIIGAAARIGGAALEASGRATVGEGGTKTGGDRTATAGGATLREAGGAVTDMWAAACVSSTRGSTTGTTPSESMDSVLARARATWAAEAEAGRAGDVLYERERAEAAEERAAEQAAASNRNMMIGIGVVALLGVGAVVLLRR